MPKIIAEHEASSFIQGYSQVMVTIHGHAPPRPREKLLEVMADARSRFVADRSLLAGALRELEAKSILVPPEVVAAIQSMQLKQWIYLRDTSIHSVFIDPSGRSAYGVLGLTEPIKNFVGGTGVIVETAVLRYMGRYISDGIVSSVVWLGRSYKRNYAEVLASLRARGRFYKTYT